MVLGHLINLASKRREVTYEDSLAARDSQLEKNQPLIKSSCPITNLIVSMNVFPDRYMKGVSQA
jgi:hypothetical protein